MRISTRIAGYVCMYMYVCICMYMYVCICNFSFVLVLSQIMAIYIQGDQKVSVHLTVTVHTIDEDDHHRIHSECGPCYTEYGLREHSSACQ
jgi:hypothetical protein